MKRISNTFSAFIKNNVIFFVTCLICTAIVITNTSILQFGRAMSGSMEPTIITGDIELNTRIFCSVERYDIVSFQQDGMLVGKRVIGLPGEKVSFKDGHVYINGTQLEEPYLDPEVKTICNKTFIVPDNSVFLLGDSRIDSYDSRYWENPYVAISEIKTKFICVIYRKKL